MAITRTPLIDDDGSGTTGSILNNAWQTGLYNAIDAAPVNVLRYTGQVLALLTLAQYHDYRPAGGELAAVWRLQPSLATALSGIQAEPNLTEHILTNSSGFAITLQNQAAGSVTANRFIGPGFAAYVLGSWLTVRIIYQTDHSAWLIQKA